MKLVCQGCCDKVPQALGGLNSRNLFCHSGEMEAGTPPRSSCWQFGFSCSLSPWFAGGRPPAASHVVIPLCTCTSEVMCVSRFPRLMRTPQSDQSRTHPNGFMLTSFTSLMALLPITVTLGGPGCQGFFNFYQFLAAHLLSHV